MRPAKLEVCVDDEESLRVAVLAGADRIELCSDLAVGGLTPTADFLKTAQSYELPIRAMIRPRRGNFFYTPCELSAMASDIAAVQKSGFEGVVLGAETLEHQLDVNSLRQLLEMANPMRATLHRVIDTLTDPLTAVEQAIDLGFYTILTSGAQTSAAKGSELIAEMVARAAGRIEIMPGAGINPSNAAEILQKTGARWLHGSFSISATAKGNQLGKFQNKVTNETQCRQMSAICRGEVIDLA